MEGIMNERKRWTMWMVAGTALMLVACGDDTATTSQGGGGSSQGGAGGEGATGGSGGEGATGGGGGATVDYTVTISNFANAPVAMVGVALDLSDGSRVEGLTDGDGMAAIPVPADITVDQITAHRDGYSFITAPTVLFMGQPPMLAIQENTDTSGWITVSGTATSMNDPANDVLFVGSTLGFGTDGTGTDSYSLLLPPGEAFEFIAMDIDPASFNGGALARAFHSVRVLSQPALSANTTIDVDFSLGTAPTASFATSLTAPMDSALAMDGAALINVQAGTFAGGATLCTPNGMQHDCVGEYWDLGQPLTTVYLVGEQSLFETGVGRGALSFQAGGPAVGLVDNGFPNPPTVTSPSGAGPHPVKSTIEYTVQAGGPTYNAEVFNIFTDDRLVGIGFGDGSMMRVPDLPSTSDEGAQFTGDGLTVQAFTCVAGTGGQCVKVGQQVWEATAP
jgi:hypothetical protein